MKTITFLVKNKMKIIIFIYSLTGGGAERVVSTLANYWVSKNWDVDVITLARSDNDFYELSNNVKRISLDLAEESENIYSKITNNYKRIKTLRIFLKKNDPDVVLSMMSTANVLLALASIGLKEFVKVGSERTHPPKSRLGVVWNYLRKYLYYNLDSVVALTEKSALWLKKNTRVKKVIVIPNTVTWPLPLINPYLKPITKDYNSKVLMAVGRLSTEKNFNILIKIFYEISQNLTNWKLVIIGEGAERANLEKQINYYGMDKSILLPGRVGNIGEWYNIADLFVLTSEFEGFPNALIEAMSYGVPAVSYDCETGPSDIIRHDIDGILVSNGDMLALKNSLKKLMYDDKLRKRYSEKSIEVRERFSLNEVIKKWEDALACK